MSHFKPNIIRRRSINLGRSWPPPEYLYDVLKKRRMRPKEFVYQEIQKNVECEVDIVYPLMCPVTQQPLVMPCIFECCLHIRCFDASYFFNRLSPPKWICPLCSLKSNFESLVIDAYFADVLKSLPVILSTDRISLKKDGSWQKVTPTEIPESVIEIDLTSEEEEDKETIETSSFCCSSCNCNCSTKSDTPSEEEDEKEITLVSLPPATNEEDPLKIDSEEEQSKLHFQERMVPQRGPGAKIVVSSLPTDGDLQTRPQTLIHLLEFLKKVEKNGSVQRFEIYFNQETQDAGST